MSILLSFKLALVIYTELAVISGIFEFLTAVLLNNQFFWDVTLCRKIVMFLLQDRTVKEES